MMKDAVIQFVVYHLRATILLLLLLVVVRRIKVSAKVKYLMMIITTIIILFPIQPKFGNGIIRSPIETNTQQVTTVATPPTSVPNVTPVTPAQPIAPSIDWVAWGLIAVVAIWFIVALYLICKQIYLHYRFKKIVRRFSSKVTPQEQKVFDEIKEALGIKKNITIRKLPTIDSPMLVGFLKQQVLYQIMK